MNIEQKTNNNTSPAIAAMQCYAQPSIQLFNCDNRILMQTLADESIDVVCIDPPYLYLKNQKLEREFDEQLFFSECKRVLTKEGFIIMFGRGTSFYRWNTILADLGFKFKEEIVWNKRLITSPMLPLARVHETISIFSKTNGKINKVKVPFIEKHKHDPKKIEEAIYRITTTFGNRESFRLLKDYYNNGVKKYNKGSFSNNNVVMENNARISQNRTVEFAITIEEGVTEQSIINETRDHYNTIHPTQKPVRLLERLLALVIPKDKAPEDIVVADFFGGSFSTMEAVYNMGMQGIACEIDKEYYELGKERIEKLPPRQTALFD